MKPTQKERSELLVRITDARSRLGYSYAEIGDRAGVDPSQVSRICRGQFATFSDSVVRICTTLDVPLRGSANGRGRRRRTATATTPANAAWTKLERSVRKAWDDTPAGAKRLARVIAAVAEISRR
jgi:transcriptional regulator with XRE-family HTH domain